MVKTLISIRSIPCFAKVGVHPAERELGQTLLVDAEIQLNTCKACISDDLSETVNYLSISDTIKNSCTKREYKLIERLSFTIAVDLLSEFSLVSSVNLQVYKKYIPADFLGDVSVKMHLSREDLDIKKHLVY